MTSSRSFCCCFDFFSAVQHFYLIFYLAECEANHSLKDLVSPIFLIPYLPLTHQLDHQWKSCFVLAPFNMALFTCSSLFYIKRPEREQGLR